MFTGLIEAVGKVLSLEKKETQATLLLEIPFAAELQLGDSVAVNGVCLTVASVHASSASFDLLTQTLQITSLHNLRAEKKVNLERALLATARLGGHFVQGHVDATGKILDYTKHGQDHRLEIALPKKVAAYCIAQGSLAVDGISLTIAELLTDSAVFWITPHTHAHTHLHQATIDDAVNLEADLLAKYAAKFMQHSLG